MSGHDVLVKRDSNLGWYARCTEFGCAWRKNAATSQRLAEALAQGHREATS